MSVTEIDPRLLTLRRWPRAAFDPGTALFCKRIKRGDRRLTIYRDPTGRRLYVEHFGVQPSVAELRRALAVQWDGAP